MSILKMAEVWSKAKVEGTELLVLLALADFADDDGLCWPSVETIGKKARMTGRGARGIMRRLERKGLLISEISVGGLGHSNRYYVMSNPEQGSVLQNGNTEPERTKPGTGVPPNLKGTTNSKDESSDSSKRGSRLSEDWTLPQPWETWALQQGLSEQQIRFHADQFRGYWIALPGQRGVKINWKATWQNRIRDVIERGSFTNGGPSSRPEPMTASDHIMADLNRRAGN